MKFNEYELKGVPLRVAIGQRDLENGTVEIARRDTLEKTTIPMESLVGEATELLEAIQKNIYKKAYDFREEHVTEVDTYEEFKKVLEEKGGFISAHWDGTAETEARIQEETKATIRCIPVGVEKVSGKCMVTGETSAQRVLFAKAY